MGSDEVAEISCRRLGHDDPSHGSLQLFELGHLAGPHLRLGYGKALENAWDPLEYLGDRAGIGIGIVDRGGQE